ncbi:MAG: flagellar assembly protein FliW [Spirochaetota bacterium]|nr:MAG: flagellar assembly protein FliW [Spirochaetota bacterium]
MKLKTKPYGEIEVDERQKVTFPEGIIGFEDIHDYYLLDSKEGPFYWLQAAKFPELAFLLIDPRLFKEDYKLSMNESDLKAMNLESKKDLLDFAIITVPEDPAKISANLMGPIVVNRKTRVAKQVISKNDEYSIKHYLLEEMRNEKEKIAETC